MRIYSMTATFGKLDHETLTLKPGLNVIQAPNEWGKSTWCAFLTAMLYGLDTRSHSTKTALSDKERYSPWSGARMAGRIDLQWNGRDITIERRSKGRTVFGDFRAYETQSGLPVPELTAQNCGQMLLGVEKTVFTRSTMIRLTDLPVTQDEALRRRLNALVTTGDDSGAGENLERRLRELKNRCRYNRTGLLPQAEAEAGDLDRKLRDLEALEIQSRNLRQRQAGLEDQAAALENHQKALAHHAAQENARLRRAAENDAHRAEEALHARQSQCAGLPSRTQAQQALDALRHIQAQWIQARIEADQAHNAPSHPLFQGMPPEEALAKTKADIAEYRKLRGRLLWILIPALLVLAAGIAALLLAPDQGIFGWSAASAGLLSFLIWALCAAVRRGKAAQIAGKYGSPDTGNWIAAAEDYVNQYQNMQHSDSQRQEALAALRQRTRDLCQGRPLAEALAYWQDICDRWNALDAAGKEHQRHLEKLRVLDALPTDAPAPEAPDELTLTAEQTRHALAENARELRELQLRLGQCQGQMEAIGHRTALEAQRETLTQRIRRLEDTYASLDLALSTLDDARTALQRRFSPRITARAQNILNRLTGGRYDRLVLGSDLTLHATTTDEGTLRSALWRSDGTADLLYLALRLAVAGELTPEAPLILDDALVRFDDARLEQAMRVLKEESVQRQILLFTCHSRESRYI